MGGEIRVYKDVMPTLQAREYKEPRMVADCKRLGNAYKVLDREQMTGMLESRAEQSRAEQSRAEQSRAT